MTLFLALCFVGVAIAGFSAFVIFWPLTLVHIRDRHPALADRFGAGAFLRADAPAMAIATNSRAKNSSMRCDRQNSAWPGARG